MATPVEIVAAKSKKIAELWNEGKSKEIVTTMYSPDACITDKDFIVEGHAEILEEFEDTKGTKYEMTLIDIKSVSEGVVIQRLICKWGDKKQNCKVEWRKIDNDWKIVREDYC